LQQGVVLTINKPAVHPPIEFRYLGFAKDFPAQKFLEKILVTFIDLKRADMSKCSYVDALVEVADSALRELDALPEPAAGWPNRDTWLRFNYSRDDLLDLSETATGSEVGAFCIEQIGDSQGGVEEQEDGGRDWFTIETVVSFDWSSAALTLRFSPDTDSDVIDCLCWVRYAEGDGEDIKRIAELLK
jgi:hypothetical protein